MALILELTDDFMTFVNLNRKIHKVRNLFMFFAFQWNSFFIHDLIIKQQRLARDISASKRAP